MGPNPIPRAEKEVHTEGTETGSQRAQRNPENLSGFSVLISPPKTLGETAKPFRRLK